MCSSRGKNLDPTTAFRTLWTADDVARFLSRSTKWVYYMAAGKRIPHISVSPGTVRFDPEDVKRWVESRKAAVDQELV